MNRTIGSLFAALSTAALFAGCANDPDITSPAAKPDGTATGTQAIGTPVAPALATSFALAGNNAAALVASGPAFLQASPHDAFVQGNVVSSGGLFYVPYERTYAGIPVV